MKFTYNPFTKSYRSDSDCGIYYDVTIICDVINNYLDITATIHKAENGTPEYIGMYDVHIHNTSVMRYGEIVPIDICHKHKIVTCKIVQDKI